jgi:hypothetical protein
MYLGVPTDDKYGIAPNIYNDYISGHLILLSSGGRITSTRLSISRLFLGSWCIKRLERVR